MKVVEQTPQTVKRKANVAKAANTYPRKRKHTQEELEEMDIDFVPYKENKPRKKPGPKKGWKLNLNQSQTQGQDDELFEHVPTWIAKGQKKPGPKKGWKQALETSSL